MKFCRKCQQVKLVSEFYRHANARDGLRGECKTCCIASVALAASRPAAKASRVRWKKEYNHSPARKQKVEQYNLKRYGLTKASYDELVAAQDAKCAICSTAHAPERRMGRLFVDHCHATGKIRGLLCLKCNTMLGFSKDDPSRLLGAVAYLKKAA